MIARWMHEILVFAKVEYFFVLRRSVLVQNFACCGREWNCCLSLKSRLVPHLSHFLAYHRRHDPLEVTLFPLWDCKTQDAHTRREFFFSLKWANEPRAATGSGRQKQTRKKTDTHGTHTLVNNNEREAERREPPSCFCMQLTDRQTDRHTDTGRGGRTIEPNNKVVAFGFRNLL